TETEQLERDAGIAFGLALNASEVARRHEVEQVQQAERALSAAEIQFDAVARGGSAALLQADQAQREAELALDTAQLSGVDQLDKALDTARSVVDQLRKDFPAALSVRTHDLAVADAQLGSAQQAIAGANDFKGIDALQSALSTVAALTKNVRLTLEQQRRISLPREDV